MFLFVNLLDFKFLIFIFKYKPSLYRLQRSRYVLGCLCSLRILRLKQFTFSECLQSAHSPWGLWGLWGMRGGGSSQEANFLYCYCRKLWKSEGDFACGNPPQHFCFIRGRRRMCCLWKCPVQACSRWMCLC